MARQRYAEARFLLEHSEYTTAAVYLAGYAAECSLKAVLLANEPAARHPSVLRTFHGVKAHDFDWLRGRLVRRRVPLGDVTKELVGLTWWTTDLRYSPSAVKPGTAKTFLDATGRILAWMETRV